MARSAKEIQNLIVEITDTQVQTLKDEGADFTEAEAKMLESFARIIQGVLRMAPPEPKVDNVEGDMKDILDTDPAIRAAIQAHLNRK